MNLLHFFFFAHFTYPLRLSCVLLRVKQVNAVLIYEKKLNFYHFSFLNFLCLLDMEYIFWRSLHNIAHGILLNIYWHYIQRRVFKVCKFIWLQLVHQWKYKIYIGKQKYHIRPSYQRLFPKTISTGTRSSLAGKLNFKIYLFY